ncbi:MAG TPA: nuclear transport factor 2 family protein [Bryobacteraceae bacterium]|nr:nuclear transport factor 2 family protein [Bryobacteraceae bacterium]
MNEQANTRVVKEMYDAFQRNDIPGLLARMDDNITFRIPGPDYVPVVGVYSGRKELETFFSKLEQAMDFSQFEPREYVAQGDRVIALGYYRGKAKATGREFEADWVMAWTIRNGKAVEFQEYTDTEAMAGAFRAERGMGA